MAVTVENGKIIITRAPSPREAAAEMVSRPLGSPITCLFLDHLSASLTVPETIAWLNEVREAVQKECERKRRKLLLLPPLIVFAESLAPQDAQALDDAGVVVINPAEECYRRLGCKTAADLLNRIADMEHTSSKKPPQDPGPSSGTSSPPVSLTDFSGYPPGFSKEALETYIRHLEG